MIKLSNAMQSLTNDKLRVRYRRAAGKALPPPEQASARSQALPLLCCESAQQRRHCETLSKPCLHLWASQSHNANLGTAVRPQQRNLRRRHDHSAAITLSASTGTLEMRIYATTHCCDYVSTFTGHASWDGG